MTLAQNMMFGVHICEGWNLPCNEPLNDDWMFSSFFVLLYFRYDDKKWDIWTFIDFTNFLFNNIPTGLKLGITYLPSVFLSIRTTDAFFVLFVKVVVLILMLAIDSGSAKTSDTNLTSLVVMRCPIWYHLYNLKNVKNTHGGLLI